MIQEIVVKKEIQQINIEELDYNCRHGIINKVDGTIRMLVVLIPIEQHKDAYAILNMNNMIVRGMLKFGDGKHIADQNQFYKTEKEAIQALFKERLLQDEIVAQIKGIMILKD